MTVLVRRITLMLLVVAGALSALSVGDRAITAHLNSDLLYPFELYRDFFIDRVDVSRLSWTPAGFLFPDLLVLGILRALLGEAGRAMHAYALFAWLSLTAAGYALCRAGGGARLPSLETALVAGALWLAALFGADRTTLVTLLPIYHHGSLVCGLLCLSILLSAALRGWTLRRQWLFFALLILASLSDLVFITQLLLPTLLALLWAARRGAVPAATLRRAWSWTVAAGVTHVVCLRILNAATGIRFRGNPIALHVQSLTSLPVLLGVAGVLLLAWRGRLLAARHGLAVGLVVGISGGSIGERVAIAVAPPTWPLANAHAFARGLYELAAHDPQLWIGLPAALLAAWITLRSVEPIGARIVSLVFIFGTAALLVEGCLTWIGHGKQVFTHPEVFDEGTLRHLQPLYVLPPFILGALALWRRQKAPPLWLLFGVVLLLSAQLAVAFPPRRAELPTPDEVRCLDGAGLHSGYGDYWVARHVNLFSERGLRVSPVELHHLGTEHWENNPARYLSISQYDFVIIGRWRRERLLARWGEPARQVSCGDWQALVYDRPDDFAFRHLLDLPALIDNQRPLPPGWGRFANEGGPAAAAIDRVTLDRPGTGDLIELGGAENSQLTLVGFDGRPLEQLHIPAGEVGLRRHWLRRQSHEPIAEIRLSPPSPLAYLFVYAD